MTRQIVSNAMIEIMEDTTVPACERVEAARVLLSLGGWEPQGEEEDTEHKVSELMAAARALVDALSRPLSPDITRLCAEVEEAISALEDDE